MQKKLNIMVAGRSNDDIVDLANALDNPEINVYTRHISNGHSNPLHNAQELPAILIFHLSELGPAELESLQEVPEQDRPHIIIIGPVNNVECMRLSMRMGIRDYLEDPCDLNELLGIISRVCDELELAPVLAPTFDDEPLEGQLTALVSAKGGAGASFLTANLAHMAAATGGRKVSLIDLDLQFGSLAQYLDLNVEHGLMHALEMADQLDAVAIDAYMSKHSSGLRLMSPAEDEIILPRDVDHSQFQTLLDLLKDSYDNTFVDLPRQIDELSADVYERADNILIITQQEIASIRDARRLHLLISNELNIPSDRFYLVVNRYNKNSIIELKDIAKSTGIDCERIITIPNSYESVAESINVGVPIFDHDKTSRVTRALIDLNSQIGGVAKSSENANVVRRVFANILGG